MIDTIKNIINEYKDNEKELKLKGHNGKEITVMLKEDIPIAEQISLVENVVESVFTTNNETNEIVYCPEVKDVAILSAILEYHTNIKGLTYEEVRILDKLGICDILADKIPNYYAYQDSIDEKIEYNKSIIIKQTNNLSEECVNMMYEVGVRAKDILDIIQSFSDTLGDFSTDEGKEKINKMISIFSDFKGNALNEKEIVKAIVEKK